MVHVEGIIQALMSTDSQLLSAEFDKEGNKATIRLSERITLMQLQTVWSHKRGHVVKPSEYELRTYHYGI